MVVLPEQHKGMCGVGDANQVVVQVKPAGDFAETALWVCSVPETWPAPSVRRW